MCRNAHEERKPHVADSSAYVTLYFLLIALTTSAVSLVHSNIVPYQNAFLPPVVECRSASSRYCSVALAALVRHRSVLARKIPVSAAPTAPRPTAHIPIPKSSPSSPEAEDKTATQKSKSMLRRRNISIRDINCSLLEQYFTVLVQTSHLNWDCISTRLSMPILFESGADCSLWVCVCFCHCTLI